MKAVKLLVFFIFCIIYSQSTYSQFADCTGAFPVCGNGAIDLAPQGTGIDDFASANNQAPDCGFIESENVWIVLEIDQPGTLGFDIIPDDIDGPDRDDYDFAVYGPNRSCNDLGASIRCSSTNPQSAGVGAETGMNEIETEFSEGPGALGNGFVHWLDAVQTGEIYYVLIDNFNRDAGFTLNFTGTAILASEIPREDIGLDLGPDVNLCDNESTELSASVVGDAQFNWSTGETGPTIVVDVPGTYTVTATTPSGCVATDEIIVTLVPAPIIDQAAVSTNNVCEPVDLFFTSTGTLGDYEWIAPDGSTLGIGNDVDLLNATATDSGTYTIRVERDNGCIDEEMIEVVIHPLPNLAVTGNQNLCENTSAILSASGALNYQWLDPSGAVVSTTDELQFANLTLADSGLYQLIGQTEFNCTNVLDFPIEVLSELSVAIQSGSTSICDTDPLDITATANQANVTFVWENPSGQVVGNSAQLMLDDLTIDDTGIYTVSVSNAMGCVASDDTLVDIGETFLFEELVEPCPGSTFTIPQNGQVVTQTEQVRIDLLTVDGCDSTFIWNVNFLSCGDLRCTGFPTALVPNGNDLNERFTALFARACIPDTFTLSIYNRWGEKIFETNDFVNGWDGTFDNQIAQQGFYLWDMEYSFPEDEGVITQREGGVNLIR